MMKKLILMGFVLCSLSALYAMQKSNIADRVAQFKAQIDPLNQKLVTLINEFAVQLEDAESKKLLQVGFGEAFRKLIPRLQEHQFNPIIFREVDDITDFYGKTLQRKTGKKSATPKEILALIGEINEVYKNKNVLPFLINDQARALAQRLGYGPQYRGLSEQDRQAVLALLPAEYLTLFTNILETRLKNAQLGTDQAAVIKQYIIEAVLGRLNWAVWENSEKKGIALRENPVASIDLYSIITDIEALRVCESAAAREAAYKERSKDVLTGAAIIQCNPGLLQWD